MKEYSTQNIRNIALASHSGSGKTMLAESLLFFSGAITRLGEINAGTTVSDFQDEEQRRGGDTCHQNGVREVRRTR